jgi:hypothetical protein
MKKPIFLLTLFLVSGIIIYFMMRGGSTIVDENDLSKIPDQKLVAMIDSIETSEWKSNSNYLRIQTEISMSESNKKINENEKKLLLGSLDTKYANSLIKKYNAIKTNFKSFPSLLYNEMIAFQSKNANLPTGVTELSAFIQLQNIKGKITQFLSSKYNKQVISNIRSNINGLPLGGLGSNPNTVMMKKDYLNDLARFEQLVEDITKYMEMRDNDDADESNFDSYGYKLSTFSEKRIEQYVYYKDWFKSYRISQRSTNN